MRSLHIHRALCVLAPILLSSFGGASHAEPALTETKAKLSTLHGTYRSTAPEDWGRGTFGRREFSFDKGRWTLIFTLALDPKFENKVFAFRTYGTYKVAAPSKSVPGAFHGDFKEDAKFVTRLTPDDKLAQGFGLAACGLMTGVEKDISEAGCAIWKPVAICSEDYDLLALDVDGGLHFGVRPPDNNLCTEDKRPAALLPAVVKG